METFVWNEHFITGEAQVDAEHQELVRIINWIIGLGGTVIGIFIKSMLDSIKDLQRSDKEMSERVGSIEVLVAGTYVKRDELRELMRKLEQIDAKLDRKANKDECGVRHQP